MVLSGFKSQRFHSRLMMGCEGAGADLANLPASRFWPTPDPLKVIQGSEYWREEFGLHPTSPLWDGVTKMMIRRGVSFPEK